MTQKNYYFRSVFQLILSLILSLMPSIIKQKNIGIYKRKILASYKQSYLPLKNCYKNKKSEFSAMIRSSDPDVDNSTSLRFSYLQLSLCSKKIKKKKRYHPNSNQLRCENTLKSRGVNRYFLLCRAQFRSGADSGLIAGSKPGSNS